MKKKYEKPELKNHGNLENVTKSGPYGGEDEDGAMPS